MPDLIVPILTLTASAGALVCIILFLLWKAKGMADFPTLSFILCAVTIFAAGFILVSAWFGLPHYNLGKPATSLEPGTYYVVSVDDGLTNDGEEPTYIYLVLAESEDDDSISYRFIRLPRNKVDESQHSRQAGVIYAVIKLGN